MLDDAPSVSIVMACRNAAPYLDAALQSARGQSVADIEILVVDDNSSDFTPRVAAQHAAQDPRIRLLTGPGRGPGAARNLALAEARGRWIAIFDSDDVMHPRRLEWLLRGTCLSCDIAADNLLEFDDPPGEKPPRLLLAAAEWCAARSVDLATFISCNALFSAHAPLGYLKPLIRRDLLQSLSIRYDETLRIGEDYDLIARLMAGGARFAYEPCPLYFYRRHPGSTSFRMRSSDVEALLHASTAFMASLHNATPDERAALAVRHASLAAALHFTRAVEQLKTRNWRAALATVLGNRRSVRLLLGAMGESLSRRLRRPQRSGPSRSLVLARDGVQSAGTGTAAIQKHAEAMVIHLDELAEPGTAKWNEDALRIASMMPLHEVICDERDFADLAVYGCPTHPGRIRFRAQPAS